MGSEQSKNTVNVEKNDDHKIITRLSQCYKNNVKTLSVLLALLADEEAKYGRDKSTIWILYRTLIDAANATDEQIIKVTETQIDNVLATNERILGYVLSMADAITKREPTETDEEWYEKCTKMVTTSSNKAIELWEYVPKNTQKSLFSYLNEMKQKMCKEEFVTTLREHPKMCAAIVAAAIVTAPATLSVYKWYTGEISGKRCVKQVTQVSSTVISAAGGGYAGTLVAAAACTNPVTGVVIVGGVIGCILAALISSYISDKVLSYILALPRDKALEAAYNFIGISCNASDEHVNAAIVRKLCQTRPRSDGTVTDNNADERNEDFQKAQLYSSIIKISRGWKPAALAIEGPKS